MPVYADVLVFLNVIVDYFLLKLCCVIVGKKAKRIRITLGSFFAGLSSLCVFLPYKGALFEAFLHIVISSVCVLITFSFISLKTFLKNTVCLFAVTYFYGGVMYALWSIFKPYGMVINNGIVYFNISPVFLIVFSALLFALTTVFKYLFSKNSPDAKRCDMTVKVGNSTANFEAVIDTGNSLCDVFGMSEIVIADRSAVKSLTKSLDETQIKVRYRAVPTVTVSGSGILDGYRMDEAEIVTENGRIFLEKPILAISETPLENKNQAIINPRSLR